MRLSKKWVHYCLIDALHQIFPFWEFSGIQYRISCLYEAISSFSFPIFNIGFQNWKISQSMSLSSSMEFDTVPEILFHNWFWPIVESQQSPHPFVVSLSKVDVGHDHACFGERFEFMIFAFFFSILTCLFYELILISWHFQIPNWTF